MKRLTSNNYHEMDMYRLELNQVYVGPDGWPWFVKSPEEECSVCDLIRNAAETLSIDLPILNDDALSDLMEDFLQYGEEEPEGILAILYRALCVMAELRDRLSRYEDTGLEPEEITDLQRAWDMYGGEEGITAMLAPPNTPLTLEELLEMILQEWLWVEVLIPSAFRRTKSGYYQAFEDYTQGEALCAGWPGVIHEFEYADYGKTWLAYRRKPEEGTTWQR